MEKAGTRVSAALAAARWIPACAGMTIWQDCPNFSVRTAPAFGSIASTLTRRKGNRYGLGREAGGERDASHAMAACGDEKSRSRARRPLRSAARRDGCWRGSCAPHRPCRAPAARSYRRRAKSAALRPGRSPISTAASSAPSSAADLVADRDARRPRQSRRGRSAVLPGEPRSGRARPARRRGHAPPWRRARRRPRIAISIAPAGRPARRSRDSGRAAAEIGAAQVGRAVPPPPSAAPRAPGRRSRSSRASASASNGGVDRVARPRMGQLEIEMRRGRHRRAGAAEPDAGRRRPAQRRPEICVRLIRPHQQRRDTAAAAAAPARTLAGRAAARARRQCPTRSSQASNSGAGRLPSTRRR